NSASSACRSSGVAAPVRPFAQSPCLRSSISLRLHVGRPDNLGPFLSYLHAELAEFGGREDEHLAAYFGKPGLELGIGKSRVDLSVERIDDLHGRVLRRAHAIPLPGFVTRHEISH